MFDASNFFSGNPEAALAEIENNKGKLYDADAVDACLSLFRRKGFQLDGTRF